MSDFMSEADPICPRCDKPVYRGDWSVRCRCTGADLRAEIETLRRDLLLSQRDAEASRQRGASVGRGMDPRGAAVSERTAINQQDGGAVIEPLKPYTKYDCPRGVGLGHSGLYTGAYLRPRPKDGVCICGERMVAEDDTKDGHVYRLEWESADPDLVDEMERREGRDVWPRLTEHEWESLPWHPVSREADTPLHITEQCRNLSTWAESHEQPIRNVRLLRSGAPTWEEVR